MAAVFPHHLRAVQTPQNKLFLFTQAAVYLSSVHGQIQSRVVNTSVSSDTGSIMATAPLARDVVLLSQHKK